MVAHWFVFCGQKRVVAEKHEPRRARRGAICFSVGVWRGVCGHLRAHRGHASDGVGVYFAPANFGAPHSREA